MTWTDVSNEFIEPTTGMKNIPLPSLDKFIVDPFNPIISVQRYEALRLEAEAVEQQYIKAFLFSANPEQDKEVRELSEKMNMIKKEVEQLWEGKE